ncbi:MAG: phage-related hypothetical protein [Rhodospirillaceae bacterium]|nr:MAG: phage-related hypothetical protein [Rhodospirillaceae bacterium]
MDARDDYGAARFFFEFFHPLATLADTLEIGGVSTVAGDDSVDLVSPASTAALVEGQDYVIVGARWRSPSRTF